MRLSGAKEAGFLKSVGDSCSLVFIRDGTGFPSAPAPESVKFFSKLFCRLESRRVAEDRGELRKVASIPQRHPISQKHGVYRSGHGTLSRFSKEGN